MKYLKKYNESKWGVVGKSHDIQHQYSIYDWFEDLKSFEWGHKKTTTSELKKWSDHFIGRGVFQEINNSVDKIMQSLKKVDLDYINDRLLDVFDTLPQQKESSAYLAVAYGDYKNFTEENRRKFNGLIYVSDPDKRKERIILSILKDIVFPTLYIGTYPSVNLRSSDDSEYVTSEKWQCKNFNIDDYQELGIREGAKVEVEHRGGKKEITIYDTDISTKRDYSIDKVMEMYRPCIVVDIGERGSDSIRTGKFSLKKLESSFDEVLPSILPTIDYEEVIWEFNRERRSFDTDEFHDYTLKILLK